MELSVVVPVHNEAGNIAPLLNEIAEVLEGRCDFEIIYINDGSSDPTAGELTAVRLEFPMLRVLTHRKACGQSTAIRSGIKAAQGDVIATLDGDGQNDPADIPVMLDRLLHAPQESRLRMVVGYRKKRCDSGVKRLSSSVANAVRGWLLKDDTPDTGCGIKVFYRDTFLDLPYFNHMHRFLPALVRRSGFEITSVEVNHRFRKCGLSKYGTLDRLVAGIVDLLGVIWLQHRSRIPEYKEEFNVLD